jgi:hypothetical protein
MRDGDEKRVVNVEIDATKGKDKMVGKVTAGVSDLLGTLYNASSTPLLSRKTINQPL